MAIDKISDGNTTKRRAGAIVVDESFNWNVDCDIQIRPSPFTRNMMPGAMLEDMMPGAM
jgi:hypothetical protein